MLCFYVFQDVGLWLEKINLGSYRQIFEENGVNGEYLEGMSMFTTEQILRFIRRCHMKWGDFITLCKELRQIKGLSLSLQHSLNLLSIHFKCITTTFFSILFLCFVEWGVNNILLSRSCLYYVYCHLTTLGNWRNLGVKIA